MTKTIGYRKVRKEDNKTLAKIIRAVFHEYDAPQEGTVYSDPTTDDLSSLFEYNGSVLFVGTVDETVVGCGGIYPTAGLPEGCVEFVKYYLRSDARGLGVGKLLMEKSIEAAKSAGFTSIYIESLPDFDKAIKIYEKIGFNYLSEPLGQTGHSGCNIWMLLEI